MASKYIYIRMYLKSQLNTNMTELSRFARSLINFSIFIIILFFQVGHNTGELAGLGWQLIARIGIILSSAGMIDSVFFIEI